MSDCITKGCGAPRTSKSWCRVHYNQYMAEYRAAHPEMIRSLNLKRLYGISLDDYETMLREQEGVCAICKRPEDQYHYRTGRPKALAVDHDHVTDRVRGLVCGRCNTLLAAAQDDVDVLGAAIEYLRVR